MNFNWLSYIELSYYFQGTLGQIAAQIVVSAKNPIHRIAAQVIVFTSGAFIFMLLDFYFQGQTYIIVYVGAIAIQFQFVIMMVHIPSGIEIDEVTEITSPKTKNVINVLYLKGKSGEDVKETSKIIKDNPKINYSSTEIFKKPNINKDSNNIITFFIIFIIIMLPIFLTIINANDILNIIGNIQNNFPKIFDFFLPIYSYFYPVWAIEYKTITDIESQAIIVYVAYPTAQIQIGLALWTVMIGIISICSPRILYE